MAIYEPISTAARSSNEGIAKSKQFKSIFLFIYSSKMLQYEIQPTIPSNYYTTIQHYKDDNYWEQQTMTTPMILT